MADTVAVTMVGNGIPIVKPRGDDTGTGVSGRDQRRREAVTG
jgi:hypothetical protein